MCSLPFFFGIHSIIITKLGTAVVAGQQFGGRLTPLIIFVRRCCRRDLAIDSVAIAIEIAIVIEIAFAIAIVVDSVVVIALALDIALATAVVVIVIAIILLSTIHRMIIRILVLIIATAPPHNK